MSSAVLRIVEATRADLPRVLRIERASFHADAWDREAFALYLSEAGSVFLIAELAGRAAGYAAAVYGGVTAELDSIAVQPKSRGSEVATRLLRSLLGRVRRRGVLSVSLMVRQDNLIAIRLYKKMGFSRARRVNNYYRDGAAAWRMRLVL